MPTALQCPECGQRHPLAELPDTALFRCRNCDRVLKVPESLRTSLHPPTVAAPSPPTARGRAPTAPTPTIAEPAAAGNGTSRRDATVVQRAATGPMPRTPAPVVRPPVATRPAPSPGQELPWPVRTGVWLAALALTLLVTLVVLRVVGILTVNRAMNVFVGAGAGRFGVLFIVLPVWALASAVVAHVALETLARATHHDRTAPVRRPRTTI